MKCNTRLNTLQCVILMGDSGWEGSYWKKCFVSISYRSGEGISYRSGEGINGQQGGPVPCWVKEHHVMSLGWITCQGLPGRLSEWNGCREGEGSKSPNGCEQHRFCLSRFPHLFRLSSLLSVSFFCQPPSFCHQLKLSKAQLQSY